MTKDTMVVVYPSTFAENKTDELIDNIKKILKIKSLKYTKIFKDDFLICVQAEDPVFVSSVNNLASEFILNIISIIAASSAPKLDAFANFG